MRVRIATQLDEPGALDVLRADGEATGRQLSRTRSSAVRATLRSPTTLALVAEEDCAVVGLLVAELRGTRLVLSLLCVAPQCRGRGAGHALVRALLDRYPDVDAADPAIMQFVRSC